MARTLRAALAVALGLAAPAAEAGSDLLRPPDLSRYVRWGVFRVRPTFSVGNVGYDDNIFYRTGSQPKEGDYTATVSPKLEGLLLFGSRGFLTFQEELDYVAFLRTSRLNYFNQRGSARLTLPFRRMGVFFEGGLHRHRDRPTSELDFRPARRELRAGVGFVFEIGPRTDLEIARTRSRWRNRDPDFRTCLAPGVPLASCPAEEVADIGDLLDRVESGERIRARWRFAGQSRLTFEASRLDIVFDNREVGTSPAFGRDSRQRRWLPGLAFGERGRVSGVVKAGRARFDAVTAGRPDFAGWIAEGELAFKLGSGTIARVGGKRDVGFAVYEANQYFLLGSAEAHLVHYFGRMLGAEAGWSRGRLSFPGSSSPAQRKDLVRRADLAVRFRVRQRPDGRRVEYRLSMTRFDRDSTLDFLDQSRTIVGLGASIGY